MMRSRTARRGLRALLCTPVVALGVLALGVGLAAPADAAYKPKKPPAHKLGASWLATQIDANDGYVESYGAPDPINTAYAVIGLRATRIGPVATAEAIAYLKTQLGVAVELGGEDAPGALSYYVMAAVSAGEDPRAFGGTAPENNLVARLLATQRTSAPDAGLFGVQDATYDGAFRQGLALAALKAAKEKKSSPAVANGTAWLAAQQCTDGLWTAYRSNTAVACPPVDFDFFTGPDTNSTATAAQGLAAWGQRPLKAELLASLDTVQGSDGGFPYLAAPGQASEPSSTALVAQALLAYQGKPTKAPWIENDKNPFEALATFQLACAAPLADRGAYEYPGIPGPNTFATVQAVVAQAKKKLPVRKTNASSAEPVALPCPA